MELALGTVQFGLDYGISNTQGQVNKTEVFDILTQAKHLGINTLDCAGAYGNSEHLLGEIFNESKLSEDFNIISKIPALNNVQHSIETAFFRSLAHLQQQQIETLLFHHSDNLLYHPKKDSLFKQALSLKSQGLIKRIGVSVYTPEQLKTIASHYPIEVVQAPINVFDQRFIATDVIEFCQQKNIVLHARSLFLQGLLFIDQDKIAPYFRPYQQKLNDFAALAQHLNCTKVTLALAMLVNGSPNSAPASRANITAQKSHTNIQQNVNNKVPKQINKSIIEKLVVGVCNTQQLRDIVEAYKLAKELSISKTELLALADERLGFINPSLWSV
ncbi:aldo/keto reductase [Pseudoalteromonas sp. AS84]|uniref:aldo/keto reductase n=1 Tax=Pseudoalteromonas sp. AS84 TaxID=3135778 RepID=UPI00316B35B0